MIYLSGAIGEDFVRVAEEKAFLGFLATPDTTKIGRAYFKWIPRFRTWAADNACFSKSSTFVLSKYLAWLEALGPWRGSCLWASAPDVVGDARATLERSLPALHEIRRVGFRACFILQDGVSRVGVPWDEVDAVFVGGSTEFKLSEDARTHVLEALRRGKATHMGRVNSYKRIKLASEWGCGTSDGTFLKFAGAEGGIPKILKWFERMDECARLTCVAPSTAGPTPIVEGGAIKPASDSWGQFGTPWIETTEERKPETNER